MEKKSKNSGGGKWIQSAIKHPGSLTEEAKRHGMSVREYCSMEHDDPRTVRRCNLYHTLMSMRAKRKRNNEKA